MLFGETWLQHSQKISFVLLVFPHGATWHFEVEITHLPPRVKMAGLMGANPLATAAVDTKARKAPENHILQLVFGSILIQVRQGEPTENQKQKRKEKPKPKKSLHMAAVWCVRVMPTFPDFNLDSTLLFHHRILARPCPRGENQSNESTSRMSQSWTRKIRRSSNILRLADSHNISSTVYIFYILSKSISTI